MSAASAVEASARPASRSERWRMDSSSDGGEHVLLLDLGRIQLDTEAGLVRQLHQAVGGQRRVLEEVQLLRHVVDQVFAERAYAGRLAGDDGQRRVHVVAVGQ